GGGAVRQGGADGLTGTARRGLAGRGTARPASRRAGTKPALYGRRTAGSCLRREDGRPARHRHYPDPAGAAGLHGRLVGTALGGLADSGDRIGDPDPLLDLLNAGVGARRGGRPDPLRWRTDG